MKTTLEPSRIFSPHVQNLWLALALGGSDIFYSLCTMHGDWIKPIQQAAADILYSAVNLFWMLVKTVPSLHHTSVLNSLVSVLQMKAFDATIIIPSDSNQTQSKLVLVTFRKKERFLLYIAMPLLITPDAPSHWLPLKKLSHYGLMSHRFWGLQLCVPLGFIQGSDSKDVTKQQEPYEGLGIRVIIVYLCLFSFNGGS